MSLRNATCVVCLLIAFLTVSTKAAFQSEIEPLVQTSCIACHSNAILSPLDMQELGYDLADPETYRTWEQVYDRVTRGEMPPVGIPLPEAAVVERALAALKESLVEADLATRAGQRVPLRRLTRLEYAYTLQDLLGISERAGLALSNQLPAEAKTVGFNTIAANQGISALHVRSYLEVANAALDTVLGLGPKPTSTKHTIDYSKSGYLAFATDAKITGFGVVKRLEDAYVTFFDTVSTYMLHSESEGYAVPYPGWYRVAVDAYPYQANSPVTLTMYRGRKAGVVASLDDLIGSFDLEGSEVSEVATYLFPGDLISVSVADLKSPPQDFTNYFAPENNVMNYKGEGIALKSLSFEGPLVENWPPAGTRELLTTVSFDSDGEIELTKDPYEHVTDVVTRFAKRAFRRPLQENEAEVYASLAKPLLDAGEPFLEAVRLPLRAILSAPSFLYHSSGSEPSADFILASRLSYFFWRSMPDAELMGLAETGELADPLVLAQQVERMFDDPKFQRFVKDFAGQAFRLYELTATNPDRRLYPEYDDRLQQSIALETELFFSELMSENHCVDQLIDSDFTFLNRRLAEHYEIPGIKGQSMRRVELPADSPRGGLLTQASIHKITANGTVTSPVPRGNFVLENLLGTPVPPPPQGVAGLEPDTRGTSTIRELLAAHRTEAVCANCHRVIDPPGFALESFNPIGGFRTQYRVMGEKVEYQGVMYPGPYRLGPAVDPSGITPAGDAFTDIEEYKALLNQEVEQIARHLVSQMFAFATGAEVSFADRDEVERIVNRLRDNDYPLRTMVHEVVQSKLFATK